VPLWHFVIRALGGVDRGHSRTGISIMKREGIVALWIVGGACENTDADDHERAWTWQTQVCGCV
jgi:hypothetical protein